MSESLRFPDGLPEEQNTIRAKCFHPSGVFVEFNKEEIEQSIPDRFEKIVEMHPGRLAVKTKTHALTYAELNRMANRVAGAILAQRGEGKKPIALLLEHDAPLITAILAVLKTGKIYVPLDPSYPLARITSMLEDAQPGLIVTNTKHLAFAQALAQQVCHVLNIDELDAHLDPENLGLSLSPDTLAYILYTSGSTGQPKGVFHNHRNVLHRVKSDTNVFHLCTDDHLSLLSSCTSNASVGDIFGALLNGATLCPFSLKEEGLVNLVNWLIQEEITIYHSVPTLFCHACGTLTGAEQFPTLRLVCLGGEPVHKKEVELYKRHFSPNCIFLNLLGITETHNITVYVIDKDTQIEGSLMPAGYTFEDKEVFLLDDNGEAVAQGHIGEIAIQSRYLSPGYWNRPDLTQGKFLPGPNGGDEHIYLTGDLGRMLPDGCLLHLGRKDFQVKIRGQRVEVADIEMALLNLGTIKEVVVVATEDRLSDRRLIAYLVPKEHPGPAVTALRRALAERLPDYMIPSSYVRLDALPLTSNGKVDRRALPAPDYMQQEQEQVLVAPRDALELQLTKIWEKVLGIRPIGVRDNFFDLGGDSLSEVRLFAQIEKIMGKNLPLAAFFQGPTVEQLARLISQQEWSAPWKSLVAIQPGGSRPPFFCVHAHDGSVLFWRDLARHLGSDQPFYGLQAQGLDGRQAPHSRIEEMAAYYIEEMRALQPEGPYFIGGHCIGGLIAFEMAQQLHGQGERVGLLALFDSAPRRQKSVPNFFLYRYRYKAIRFFQTVNLHVSNLLILGPRERLPYIKAKLDKALYKLYMGIGSPWVRAARNRRKILNAGTQAARNYNPEVYPGRVTLFRATNLPAGFNHDSQMGWGRLAGGGLEVHLIPGYHAHIVLEPRVRLLAKQLMACLRKAQEIEGSGQIARGEQSQEESGHQPLLREERKIGLVPSWSPPPGSAQ